MRRQLFDGRMRGVFLYYFDLSENYTLKNQYAPQSTHWGLQNITLATAVGFYVRVEGPIVVEKVEIFCLSEALNHDSNMTSRCERVIESWFITAFPCVHTFMPFVDNAPQHFRTNKYISSLADACEHDHRTRDLHYWGKYHGKTVGDSAGGNLKKYLDGVSTREEIKDLPQLCTYITDRYKKVNKSSKVTLRKAIHVPLRSAQYMQVTARKVPRLKSYFNYSFSYDEEKNRVISCRRYLSCVSCARCCVGDCNACEDQEVGVPEVIFE